MNMRSRAACWPGRARALGAMNDGAPAPDLSPRAPRPDRTGADGRPMKRAFGPWAERLWPLLARMRGLRGTWADPFRHSAERREDRGALLALYEGDLARLRAGSVDPTTARALVDWARCGAGFGPIRAAGAARARGGPMPRWPGPCRCRSRRNRRDLSPARHWPSQACHPALRQSRRAFARGPAMPGDVGRDLTYASGASTPRARTMIRAIEAATGRHRLIRRAAGYQADLARGAPFLGRDGRRGGRPAAAASSRQSGPDPRPRGPRPCRQPPIRHPRWADARPYPGGRRGSDFRILANAVFARAPDLQDTVLPIDFGGTLAARQTNLPRAPRAQAWVEGGGALGVFPGGTVSTAPHPRGAGRPTPAWRTFTAKVIQRSGATVVPVWFDGENSRLFQMASHLHATLRLGLLLREFPRGWTARCRRVIGAPILPDQIAARAGGRAGADGFPAPKHVCLVPKAHRPHGTGP